MNLKDYCHVGKRFDIHYGLKDENGQISRKEKVLLQQNNCFLIDVRKKAKITLWYVLVI